MKCLLYHPCMSVAQRVPFLLEKMGCSAVNYVPKYVRMWGGFIMDAPPNGINVMWCHIGAFIMGSS